MAMTGEVSLTGKILPVGGIKEKTIAVRARVGRGPRLSWGAGHSQAGFAPGVAERGRNVLWRNLLVGVGILLVSPGVRKEVKTEAACRIFLF